MRLVEFVIQFGPYSTFALQHVLSVAKSTNANNPREKKVVLAGAVRAVGDSIYCTVIDPMHGRDRYTGSAGRARRSFPAIR
jgi:hypothetical protein